MNEFINKKKKVNFGWINGQMSDFFLFLNKLMNNSTDRKFQSKNQI